MTEVEKPNHDGAPGTKIRAYNSETSTETVNEIESKKIKPNRNLLRIEIVKKRKDFNQPFKFIDN